MPDLQFNREFWDGRYGWAGRGEEWSVNWGGSEPQWFGSLYPRLHRVLPAASILELAPGMGRWTKFLLPLCRNYLGIDLSLECVQECQKVFADARHARFVQNDGYSLSEAEDCSFDLVFSFDSLVHVEFDVLESYVTQILQKLNNDGVAFLHHSNMGAVEAGLPNLGFRALSVSGKIIEDLIVERGGQVIIQEVITWNDGTMPQDCLTMFAKDVGMQAEPMRLHNMRFMDEAEMIRRFHAPYSQVANRLNPDDAQSVFNLAQSYFDLGDFANARKWSARRAQMGGWDEQVYHSMFLVAESMVELGAPWPEIEDAYLKSWEYRPTRAEPLYAIARSFRVDQHYPLGYLFAKRAAEIPLPEEDQLFVRPEIYGWRAVDEQAVCASWIGKHAESFTLCRHLLALPGIPDEDRQRIALNRDVCVPTMLAEASPYPDALVRRLGSGTGEAEVIVSLDAGPDRASAEQSLNSFLNCCTDVSRVGRFVVVDRGLSAEDRTMLRECYGFLEFANIGPLEEVRGPSTRLAQLRTQIDGRFWLHLGQGWRFFAPEKLITRLTMVLEAEPEVFQVGINFADANRLTGACGAEGAVRRAPDAGRYVLADAPASGPAMFDTARLDRAGGVQGTDPDSLAALGRRAAAAGLRTASLDEVLCIAGG